MANSAKKSAIITGASGGIGSEVARRLVKDGFAVVVHYAGKPAPAQAVVAELKAAGGQAIAVQADVASVPDVERLFKETIDAFGNPPVVVHSAGIMPLSLISAGDVETFDKVIATNLRGTFLVLAQALHSTFVCVKSPISVCGNRVSYALLQAEPRHLADGR
jgi:3-oxoacyl-[acyl-carrier protein] reductase